MDTINGNGAVIGLIDQTGAGLVHNDLTPKLLSNSNIANTTNTSHGTWMAGLMAASVNNGLGIAGVGYGAKLRTYNNSLYNTGDQVSSTAGINGVNQAVQDGVKIINLSFTFASSGSMEAAIINAINSNVIVLTASGNNFYNSGCDIPRVICVTSVDENDVHSTTRNQSSSAVALSSPDRGYTSTGPNNGYQIMYRGTSQSTALVSGAAALMKGAFTYMSQSQAKEWLRCSADDVSGLGSNGTTYAGRIGTGRLNSYRAVQQALVYQGNITGESVLCPNRTATFTVPSYTDAQYNWTVQGAMTFYGQGANSISVTTSSAFNGGRVECAITIGRCTQLKPFTIGSYYGCTGGFRIAATPNPVSDRLFITAGDTETGTEQPDFEKRHEQSLYFPSGFSGSLSVRYQLVDVAGRVHYDVISDGTTEFDTSRLSSGIYYIRAITAESSVTEPIVIVRR